MDNAKVDSLGFGYDPVTFRSDPVRDVRRACFRVRKVLEGVVHDTVALEGNPFTLPEVKTLLDGVTVGGHRLEDERQVLNQAASWKELLARVQRGRFELTRKTFCDLHALVAREEAVEWGVFRTGSVTIAGTDYRPPRWESLESIFEEGLESLNKIDGRHERAIAMFLFGSLNQFFYDGNKRTSRLMMNGILLGAGEDAISVPARRRLEFNEAMIRFYDSRDGTEMMRFMAGCSLDSRLRVDS
ncbi:MAG: Fic family protein [Gammaproteobacteria bacterium]|nr:Fic family protein [Gammaproteobacteria bacterium]